MEYKFHPFLISMICLELDSPLNGMNVFFPMTHLVEEPQNYEKDHRALYFLGSYNGRLGDKVPGGSWR